MSDPFVLSCFHQDLASRVSDPGPRHAMGSLIQLSEQACLREPTPTQLSCNTIDTPLTHPAHPYRFFLAGP